MLSIGRFLISTAELAEAEGRVLRRHVTQLARAAAIGLVALFLAMSGIYWIIHGIYYFLFQRIGETGAALTIGICLLIAAGGLLWTLKKSDRKMQSPPILPKSEINSSRPN